MGKSKINTEETKAIINSRKFTNLGLMRIA